MDANVKIGIMGCGNIFKQYINGCRAFKILDVVAVADIDFSRAEARAAEFDIPHAYTPEQMLADPEIQLVINLTVPLAHAEVSRAILAAGKHVYSEKPLGITREDGQNILQMARERGLLVGCAPDTVLGGGIQTCRKLIDDGAIGFPVAATAFMLGHGVETWHPNPFFYYQVGGGPMFDMGPYYLTALVTLLGAVRRVTGSTRMSFAERVATTKDLYGQRIKVEIPTHVAGILDFAAGPVATIVTSFDVWSAAVPRIEIYGSEGTLSVPDPNTFGGPVLLRPAGEKEWQDVPLTHSAEIGRGTGVADMAYSMLYGRAPRASGDLAYHVLDIMHAIHDSSNEERHIHLDSGVERPAALPLDLPKGELDAGRVA